MISTATVAANETARIWCRAKNSAEPGILYALFWRYTNGTRLPHVNRAESSDHDVYMERFEGTTAVYTSTWSRVLHFNTTKFVSPAVYICTANYAGIRKNHSVQVSGVCKSAIIIAIFKLLHSLPLSMIYT